jgi:hypothetical protein
VICITIPWIKIFIVDVCQVNTLVQLIQYQDQLPKIPPELIAQLLREYQQHEVQFVNPERVLADGEKSIPNVFYKRWGVPETLETWIRQNVSNRFDMLGFQIHDAAVRDSNHHLPHTDKYPRKWVLNYVIETGGDNAVTSFYQEQGHPAIREHLTRPGRREDLEVLASERIEPCRWIMLSGVVIHDVTGITGRRMSITMGIDAPDPAAFFVND